MAVLTPSATFEGDFLHRDLVEMGGAYLYHLVQNHPFLDGNKRTGTVAALIFFAMNAVEIQMDEDHLAEMVLAVARSEMTKAKVAEFFRERMVRI